MGEIHSARCPVCGLRWSLRTRQGVRRFQAAVDPEGDFILVQESGERGVSGPSKHWTWGTR